MTDKPKKVNAIITVTLKIEAQVILNREGNVEDIEEFGDILDENGDAELVEIKNIITSH